MANALKNSYTTGIPHSGPANIESVYLLHGNSSGEILFEMTGLAHTYFDMILQDRKDASEYGYYKHDKELSFENVSILAGGAASGIAD